MTDRLFTEGRMALKRCRHGLMTFNVNDSMVGRSLDLYGEWCEGEIDIIAEILRPGDLALDLGANIGTHTLAFARMVGPTGAVIAFEPQRQVFQMLCGNVAMNGLENVECRKQAVGAAAGKIVVPALDMGVENNFGGLALGGHADGEPVELVTVDSLALPACRLIKADVEGMEPEVLLGARETIARCRPALFLECNTDEAMSRLKPILDGLGYVAHRHVEEYFNPGNFFGNPGNVFAHYRPQSNLLCVPA